jgi:hypothetical protein
VIYLERKFGIIVTASKKIAEMYDWERYENVRNRLNDEKFESQIEVLRLKMQEFLDHQGIDITDKDYKKNKEYRKIKNHPWIFVSKKAITVGKFIEHYLLKEGIIEYPYKSNYNMGSKTDLNDDDCTPEMLGKEISSHLGEKDKHSGKAFKTLIDNMFSYEENMILRFEKHLKLVTDISFLYDKKNLSDWFKILYFFYMLEHREYPGQDVLEILSTLSIENWSEPFHDFPSIDLPTQNRLVTGYIKESIAKELSQEILLKIERSLLRITREWTLLLENARTYDSVLSKHSHDNGFQRILDLLEPVPQRLNDDFVPSTVELRKS